MDPQLSVRLVDQKSLMYQINERLDTFSKKEKDRIRDSEGATKLRTLISKYGKAKVAAATKEAESENRGKKITYRQLRHRIENAKGRLKKGEVKKWDKEKGRWVSNKEEMQERTMTPAEKQKDTKLKKKYEKSDTMMDNFKDQYGEKEGKSVFYAYIRKKAMEKK